MTGPDQGILIIEDEIPVSRAISAKLKLVGLNPLAVSSGIQAVEILKKDKFGLIVLDLMLPDIDGFAILEKMRELKIETPVLVVSALSQPEDKKRALELGAKDYFYKGDISLSDLADKVKYLMTNKN